jgi:hypothetical protein
MVYAWSRDHHKPIEARRCRLGNREASRSLPKRWNLLNRELILGAPSFCCAASLFISVIKPTQDSRQTKHAATNFAVARILFFLSRPEMSLSEGDRRPAPVLHSKLKSGPDACSIAGPQSARQLLSAWLFLPNEVE